MATIEPSFTNIHISTTAQEVFIYKQLKLRFRALGSDLLVSFERLWVTPGCILFS